MSVIVDISIPADQFELGRILDAHPPGGLDLETMVPIGDRSVPLITVHGDRKSEFEALVRQHDSVADLTLVDDHDGETLYALDWSVTDDRLFQAMAVSDAYLLNATGSPTSWAFEIRFPTHAALKEFRDECDAVEIDIELERLYNPSKPDAGPWFDLTERQRETLRLAVQEGYYDIPRRISTKELADKLGVSDQAVTERLRRAIVTLVDNTLLSAPEVQESPVVGRSED